MKRLGALLIITSLLFLFSCDQPAIDHFAEYRGTNLSPEISSWSSVVDSEYLSFAQQSAETGSGGTASYRVETLNLFPNGDFENTDYPEWKEYHHSTEIAPDLNLVSGDTAISGQSLYYRIYRQTQVIFFNLASLKDEMKGTRYQIHFLLNSGSNTNKCNFFIDDQYTEKPELYWEIPTETDTGFEDIFIFPGTTYTGNFATPNDSSSLYFGLGDPTSSEEQLGTIDNIEIIRSDQQNIISVFIPVSSEGRPDLLDGSYRFTLYVKNESGENLSPIVKNRFAAKGIHLSQWLEINKSAEEGWVQSALSGFEQINYTADKFTSGDWTAVTLDFTMQLSQIYENRLRINISPTLLSSESTDRSQELCSGSILISAPHLEFIPEGL